MKVILICKETRLYLVSEIEAEPQVGRIVTVRQYRDKPTMNVYKIVDIKYSTFIYYERSKQEGEKDDVVNIEVLLEPIYYNFHTDTNNYKHNCGVCKYNKDQICENARSDKHTKKVHQHDICLEGFKEMKVNNEKNG